MCFKTFLLLILVIPIAGLSADSKVEFYLNKVKPLIKSECYKCHSHESGKSKGGLMLDSVNAILKGGGSGPAIIPGNAQKSSLIQTVKRLDEDEAMPPKKSLSTYQISILEKWINDGAHGPKSEIQEDRTLEKRAKKLWSFQPIKNVSLPAGFEGTEIDYFINKKLKTKKLKPLAQAAPHHLIRRLYIDLLGILPSPQEAEAYIKNPTKENFAKTVDKLLESERFGERWGRHWLDTARYSECNGGDRNHIYKKAWKYRNWVIDAVNDDLGYDKFLAYQIAGDLIPAVNQEQKNKQIIATAYLALGSKPTTNRPELQEETEFEGLLDQVDAVYVGTMGLTVGCAKCHDHKFDPISTRDYYAMAGIMKSSRFWYGMPFGYVPNFYRDKKTGSIGAGYDAQFNDMLDPNLYTLDREKFKQIKPVADTYIKLSYDAHALSKRRETLEKRHLKKLYKKKELGELSAKEKKSIVTYEKELKEIIPKVEAAKHALDDYLSKNKVISPEQVMATTELQPTNVKVRYSGEYNNVGELVPRGMLSLLKFPGSEVRIPPKTSGRLELSRWVVNKNNPLTARVAVNRIWNRLFGRGIVDSLDNFGLSGSSPTHPELLDYLAYQFKETLSWSRKALIRQIVISEAYMRSAVNPEPGNYQKVDPLNQYLWRMNPRRMEVEAIRDSILAITESIDYERPGPSITNNAEYHLNGRLDPKLIDRSRKLILGSKRTVYLPVYRLHHPELLSLFDYPDDESVVSQRTSNTFATQGLFLINNELIANSARKLSIILREDPALSSDLDKLKKLYMLAFSRQPNSMEIKKDLEFLEKMKESPNPWESLCQSFLVCSEFLYRF